MAASSGQVPRAPPRQGFTSSVPAQQGAQYAARQQILEPVSVNDVISESVVAADPDTQVQTVVGMMDQEDVGSVVVVEDNNPLGIVTDRKIALALKDTSDIAERPIREFVSENLVTADPSMNLFDLIQVMSDQGIRRMPVVDNDGSLRGIVTLDDVVVLLGTEMNNVSETIQTQISRL